jgi:exopolysaccharide biosynthesis polyprenyl glycosylphosphotransferase
MKRSELLFSAILVPVDYVMVVLAGLLAYELRFASGITELRPVLYELPLREFFPILLIVGVLWTAVFAISGLYFVRARRFIDELTRIFFACSTGVMLLIVIIFFQRELFSSRFIILSGWVLAILTVSLGRSLVRTIQRTLFRRGVGLHNVVIIGQDKTTTDVVRHIYQHASLGYRITARYDAFTPELLAELEEKLATAPFDEILQADASLTKEQTLQLIDFANDHHVTFRYAADLFSAQAAKVQVNTLAGIPFLEIVRTPLDGWGKILKRVFDTIVAALLLIILSPLFLFLSLLVRLDSEGGSFVRLRRVGEKNRPFMLYKFRSMVKNAHEMKPALTAFNERPDGPLFKMKNDPRITRVGAFLRKTSLDELPQLWNVLRGQMSLVGPRPHEPEEVARYEKRHRKLLTLKPGITGLAQVSGRSDLTFEEEFRLDMSYIEQWSMRLDLAILLKTPWVVLTMRSAT